MATIRKINMYVLDFNDDLNTEELEDMINQYVLDRIGTHAECKLVERKKRQIEWHDEHPLNFDENFNNVRIWNYLLWKGDLPTDQ